jgi:hypothetical protein
MNTRYERMRELIWAIAFTDTVKDLRQKEFGYSPREIAEMANEDANLAVNIYAIAAERRMVEEMV